MEKINAFKVLLKNQHRLIGIRASTYISEKLKKRTYTYKLLQFSVEMNTRASKTPTTFTTRIPEMLGRF